MGNQDGDIYPHGVSKRVEEDLQEVFCFASFFHVQAALREEVERLTARAKDADAAVQKLAQKQVCLSCLILGWGRGGGDW